MSKPEERIEELEAQVTELRGLVEILMSRSPENPEGLEEQLELPVDSEMKPMLSERVRMRVGEALGGGVG